MNRHQAKELLPIIQAFAEGKTIQYRHGDVDWVDVAPYSTLSFSDDASKYRIKSKSKYRPFNDAEECWQEMLKHKPFGWVKDISSIQSIIHINNDGIIANNGVANNYYTFKRSFNLKFTDDTPFGVGE